MKILIGIGMVVGVILVILYLGILTKWERKKKIRVVGILVLVISMAVIGKLGVSYAMLKPMLELNGMQQMEIEVGEDYHELGASAKMRNTDISDKIVIQNEVDTKKIGTYEIYYTIQSGYQKEQITRKIIVKDTTCPVIKLKGKKVITQRKNQDYQELGYQAIDNYDGDITRTSYR